MLKSIVPASASQHKSDLHLKQPSVGCLTVRKVSFSPSRFHPLNMHLCVHLVASATHLLLPSLYMLIYVHLLQLSEVSVLQMSIHLQLSMFRAACLHPLRLLQLKSAEGSMTRSDPTFAIVSAIHWWAWLSFLVSPFGSINIKGPFMRSEQQIVMLLNRGSQM